MADLYHHQVSIILVTYNSLPELKKCLHNLKKISGISYQIVLVDNNSHDNSVKVALEYFPQATIIENKKNIGFASACNIGAKKSDGEYLLFCNPDLRLDENALFHLLKVYGEKKQIGALSGRMRFPDGSFQPTCRNFPAVKNLLFSRGSVLSRLLGKNNYYTLPDYKEITEVPAVAGTLMVIKRDLFFEIGGFDERFFMYLEDTDLCLRLHQKGYKNYFVPNAGGVHLWGKGSQAGKIKRNWYHHYSLWKYFIKYFPNPFTFLILPFVLIINFILKLLFPFKTGK